MLLVVDRRTNRTHQDYNGEINGTIEFLDHKNMGQDTKIIILGGLFEVSL